MTAGNGAFDVVVIGAGPAGMAAAIAASQAGAAVLVLDEQAAPGGQVHRAIESRILKGRDDIDGLALVRAFRASSAERWPGAAVWQIEPMPEASDRGFTVSIIRAGAAQRLAARQVIVATGANERPVPIVGWTLPGVMTVGAAQILLKTGGNVPAGRTVIAGQGPLVLLYASQMLAAGVRPAAILDTTAPGALRSALRHLPGALADLGQIARGLGFMAAIRKAGVPVMRGVRDVKAEGRGRLEEVHHLSAGRWRTMPADLLLLHEGVTPHTHPAMSAGAAHGWDAAQLCWRPLLDGDGETTVRGLRVAGDGGGIAGWRLAAMDGERVGLAAARALGLSRRHGPSEADLQRRSARHRPLRRFLDAYNRPRTAILCPADDVVVCRCENRTAGDIRAAVEAGCLGPNQVKVMTRCGMGPCQGRECALTLSALVAEARRMTPDAVGHLTIRPPLKPLTLGELASLPASVQAAQALP